MAEEEKRIDREFIPSLREGVDVIRMIFFKEMRQHFAEKTPGQEAQFYGMLAGAVMNELFGTPNPAEKFTTFAAQNRARIDEELAAVADNFAKLRIPLTDALRIHYLCNYQEGIEGDEATVLARARELGVLIEERDVPLPKGFMQLVYRVGKAHGLIREQNSA
ncbi:MAG: hypothetical protein C0613_09000 [Desulfobulbaceae bacterium]|nr:MAG: hypothetical protein C0613_09000 [Desulfobulbaceae bacterium]